MKFCCTTNMPRHTAFLYSTKFFASQILPVLRALRLLVLPIGFVTNLAKCLVLAEAGKRLR